jgi:PHD/YefM family antitoxin component YafN of YafNO toxin-antitoxin module
MQHDRRKLQAHILELSEANDWATALLEWEFVHAEISDEPDHCPCGQEIREHCYIRNRRNDNETYVGNVCVNKFMAMNTGTLFDGLKRLMKKVDANANDAVIEYAQERGYLYDEKEYKFLMDTRRTRLLSPAQKSWKEKINRRILQKIQVRKRGSRG